MFMFVFSQEVSGGLKIIMGNFRFSARLVLKSLIGIFLEIDTILISNILKLNIICSI